MAGQGLHADWSRRYRVAQWATGNVGVRALRRIIEHPNLDLVGVWVHSANKVGRDAGDLCGMDPVGVKATNSIEDVIASKPDCVLYMPHSVEFDDVCRLLESGANVITTRTEFQNPDGVPPEKLERLLEACRKGNTSIHGTGSSPGFITEALPIVLTSLSRRVDRLTISEFADNSTRNSPEMLRGMGFGSPPGPAPEWRLNHMREAFGETLALIAKAMGRPFDKVVVKGEQGITRKDKEIAIGTIPAGTVGATRTSISGMVDGKPFMTFQSVWYVSDDVDTTDGEEWLFRPSEKYPRSGWHILLEGDTPMEITIAFPVVATEDYAAFTPNLTAHRPINCIPYVCAAAPGLVTTIDLPQVIAKLDGGRN